MRNENKNIITINGVDYTEDQLTEYQKVIIASVQRCGNDINDFTNQLNELSIEVDKLQHNIRIYEKAKEGYANDLLKDLAENDLGEMILPEPEPELKPAKVKKDGKQ